MTKPSGATDPNARAEFVEWLAALPPAERDDAVEARLGIDAGADSAPPGRGLIGYHASGLAPIVRAFMEAPLTEDDVLVDIGAGLGKVVLLSALMTGARSRGIELQPALAARALGAADRLGVRVEIEVGDVREASLDDGTVFFLYCPFTAEGRDAVLRKLEIVAKNRQIVVCALGIDLDVAPWLVRRPIDSFWLAIYDSAIQGALPRAIREPNFSAAWSSIANERAVE